jgi:hypothetical protein
MVGAYLKGATMTTEADQWVPHEPSTWPWRNARLREPVTFRDWGRLGAKSEFTERVVPAGTPVRIVMVSRLGDVGITTNMRAEHGYNARVLLSQLEPMA